jgi:hypothetical protein
MTKSFLEAQMAYQKTIRSDVGERRASEIRTRQRNRDSALSRVLNAGRDNMRKVLVLCTLVVVLALHGSPTFTGAQTTPATPTSPPTESPCASCTLTPSPSVQTIPPRPTPPAGTSSLSPGPSTPFVVTPTPFPAALPATGGSQSPPANGMSNWMIAIAGLTIAVALILFAWLYARVTERV